MFDYKAIIDKYYKPGSDLREILVCHSKMVAKKALDIAARKALPLDEKEIEAAAMLHDIGIFLTDAPGICCYGKEPYLRHGVVGAELLRNDGAPEWLARIAERHTGAGLTRDDIIAQGLPIALSDYCPETLLEKLICYADKFYSKSGDIKQEKPLERVRASLAKFGSETLARFEALHSMFS